ncbi:MAG: hypothetical protein M3Z84_05045 [Actinomycetota bacterium]|nr:hypothetical protein [Actinomycetota bacterium]
MHPIEQLRVVARAKGEDPGLLAQEAARALGNLRGDGAMLVTACRRLVDRQPACGPLWWVGARVLGAADPTEEAYLVADELARDRTPSVLGRELAEEARVAVVGWPGQASQVLRRRGDVDVLVVEADGSGSALASQLRRAGTSVSLVPESGLGQAVGVADLVLLEGSAVGETGLVATAGSYAAAAVAYDTGVPVWVVAGVGRVLPPPLWEALRARVVEDLRPGHGDNDIVPARLVDRVVGPDEVQTFSAALARADFPSVPELTRRAPAPGSAVG